MLNIDMLIKNNQGPTALERYCISHIVTIWGLRIFQILEDDNIILYGLKELK